MRLALILLGIGLAGSCKSEGNKTAPKSQEGTPPPTRPTTDPTIRSEAVRPMTKKPANIDAKAMTTTTKGLNKFTLALYKAADKQGNAMLSPLSVAAALSLVELGSEGETALEIHKALGAVSAEQHRRGLQDLIATISGDGLPVNQHGVEIQPHRLRFANSLWPAKNYTLQDQFIKDAQERYGALAQSIDLADPAGAAKQVNDWVLEATADKIKDLVSAGDVGPQTRLILVNAVHFLGRWREPFREQATKDAPFYVDGKDKGVPVPTMVGSHYFKALDNEEVTIAELPYWSTSDESEMVMTIIVPKKRDGLAALEAKLSVSLLEEWISKLSASVTVAVHLPKWKAETSARLGETLNGLGVSRIFAPTAELSGISAEEGLQVSAVLHKTYINVDEKGTEAAAATAMMVAGGMPQEPIDMRVDHPFLYLIRESKTGAVLFVGRVVDPR